MLGLRLVGGRHDLRHVHRTASGLDRLARALRHAGDREVELRRKHALAEQPHAVLAAARQARRVERRLIDRRVRIQRSRVDRLLDRAQVHLGIVLGVDVVEAALRDPHVERHLAAFETVDGDALAAALALLAAPAGLALAGTDTTADPHPAVTGAFVVADVVQFHGYALAFAMFALKTKALSPWGVGLGEGRCLTETGACG